MNKIKFLLCLALLVSGVEGKGQIYINSYAFGGAAALDANAQAFLDSAGITNQTIINAVNELVLDLKLYNLWDSCIAIYPFVGGTVNAHRLNLKDPRNLDNAFRISFTGSFSHTINGIQGCGTGCFGNTFIFPATNLKQNSTHVSVFSRTDVAGSSVFFGTGNGLSGLPNSIALYPKLAGDNLAYGNVNSSGGSNVLGNFANSSGFFILNRVNSSAINLYRNNTKINTGLSSTTPTSNSIYISAYNTGTTSALNDSQRILAFMSIGVGLNDTQAANLNTAIQKFQTTLGRNL